MPKAINDDTTETEEEPNDGFNVVAEMNLRGWADFGFDDSMEAIHLIPDPEARELRCYRTVGRAEEGNRRIKTTIDRVKFTFYFDGEENRDLEYLYLTGQEAETFLTFVDLLNRGRASSVGFDWWEESGMPMMQDVPTGIEVINLRFTTSNGVERRLQISNAWQSPKSHKMAHIPGDTY